MGKPPVSIVKRILDKRIVIGSGCYRTVYGTKYGKWVVKVDDSGSVGGIGSNAHEYKTYQKLTSIIDSLPDGVKLPEMHYIDGCIVAERIKGKHPKGNCSASLNYHFGGCAGRDKCWTIKLKDIRLKDIHSENVMITADGTIYIVDIGHGEKIELTARA